MWKQIIFPRSGALLNEDKHPIVVNTKFTRAPRKLSIEDITAARFSIDTTLGAEKLACQPREVNGHIETCGVGICAVRNSVEVTCPAGQVGCAMQVSETVVTFLQTSISS